ncbi:MAG: thiamine pyrophosphate-binding protein, partial [Clostridia bacterium]|nr:thiamine pyrophosphate-binding protein [Clostridia bacterium]
MTGAQYLVQFLISRGVSTVFGYPGAPLLEVYDEIRAAGETAAAALKDPLRHILMRHEQGAAHAACGYAKACGKPGVCLATSGPGAINLVTGIADAMLDSVPMLCLTGQVDTAEIGRDAFQ